MDDRDFLDTEYCSNILKYYHPFYLINWLVNKTIVDDE